VLHKTDIRCFLRLKVYTNSYFGQTFFINISFPLIQSQETLILACSKEMCILQRTRAGMLLYSRAEHTTAEAQQFLLKLLCAV